MGKRLIFFTFVLFILCAGCAMAADEIEMKTESLVVNAEVPEDYGIVFPQDALHMDRIYFSLQTDRADDYLISEKTLIDLGDMEIGLNEFSLTLIYYGNQIDNYTFTIEADAGIGWYDENGNTLPIEIKLTDSETDDDIYVAEISNSLVTVFVPSAGPRRGEPVADVFLSWNPGLDPEPGEYSALLTLRMNTL